MNAGIQGLAADIFKVALVRLDAALEEGGLASRLVLQVHDEVILEVPPDEEEVATAIVLGAMEARPTCGCRWRSTCRGRHLGRRQVRIGRGADAPEPGTRSCRAAELGDDARSGLDGGDSDADRTGFEPIGRPPAGAPTCGTRSPRAPTRRSASSSTSSASNRACGCSTSAAGPGRHAPRLAGAGPRGASASTSAQRFLELARRGPRPGPTFERLDARRCRSRRVRRRHLAVPGRLRAARRRRGRRRVLRPSMARRRAARAAGLAVSAPSPPTSRCGTSRTATPSTPATGVNHERTAVRNEAGERRRAFDLWTTCFTPRELRLLAGRGRPASSRTSGRWRPGTTRPGRPTSITRSSCWSRAEPGSSHAR